MIAVIIAGGKGKRLRPFTNSIPKPMIEIAGKPVLEHQILKLRKYGISEFWILTGYLGEVIEQYFRDGSNLGVNIHCIKETKALGTAGALKQLTNILHDDFIVFYGDIIFDMDLHTFIQFHNQKKGAASLVVQPTDHMEDCDLLEIDQKDRIVKILAKPRPFGCYENLNNAAFYILSKRVLDFIPNDIQSDLMKDVFPKMLSEKEKLFAYKTSEYIRDMGTLDRLEKVSIDIASGMVLKKSKKFKQKAIMIYSKTSFLNQRPNYDLRINTLWKVLKQINLSNYIVFLCIEQNIDHCQDTYKKLKAKIDSAFGKKNVFIDELLVFKSEVVLQNKNRIGPNTECSSNMDKIRNLLSHHNVSLGESWLVGPWPPSEKRTITQSLGLKIYDVDDFYGEQTDSTIYETLSNSINWIIGNK